MFSMFNAVIYTAPQWTREKYLVGRPINAIIATCMQTSAGRAIFDDKEVNAHIKKMFDVWAVHLTSKNSRDVLSTKDGWLSSESLARLTIPRYDDNDPDKPTNPLKFEDAYACDLTDKDYYGFQSWDDFFVRRLKDIQQIRPIPTGNSLITCACESHLYRIANEVKLTDKFWVKDNAYSLQHMLNDDVEFANKFVGGMVFQTYLSPSDYHRWHSPVKGRVTKIVQVPGTYYSVYPDITNDPAPNELSVGLLPHVATRVLIYIQADDNRIGLVCFIGIGMFEVSTCQVVVQEGDILDNGSELGMFHFGGSSHCLIFQKDAKIKFNSSWSFPYIQPDPTKRPRVMVNRSIASVIDGA
jgi:phosphatidylserine decarboxylase